MYEQELTPPEGELMSQAGYWLSVSRRADDGSWKLHWLITNSVAPSM
jgi:hypothetical protein